MRIPVIKIRTTSDGDFYDRFVGTDPHDCLFVENGGIFYLNVQGMISSQDHEKGAPAYDFVTKPFQDIAETFSGQPEIEFVSVEEFLALIKRALDQEYEDEVGFQNLIQKMSQTSILNDEHEKRMERLMQSPHYFWHT